MNGTGMSERLSRLVGAPLGRLLGISKSAVYAVLLGSLGGFPIGAVCVRELYSSGRLTLKEAQRLTALSSNASPAFCIATLGSAVLGDRAAGVRLYLCQLVAILIIGAVWRAPKPRSDAPTLNRSSRSVSDVLTDAVGNGAVTMLKICAFAVFFAVIGDLICLGIMRGFGIYAASAAAALTELTLAGRYAAGLEGSAATVITAFAVGWSGISVHMQTASVLSGSGISMSPFRRAKLVQGLLCAVIMYTSSLISSHI